MNITNVTYVAVAFKLSVAHRLMSRSVRNLSGTSSGADGSLVASLVCSPGAECEGVVIDNMSLNPCALFVCLGYIVLNLRLFQTCSLPAADHDLHSKYCRKPAAGT